MLAYYEICPFPVNYEFVMFYSTGLWIGYDLTHKYQTSLKNTGAKHSSLFCPSVGDEEKTVLRRRLQFRARRGRFSRAPLSHRRHRLEVAEAVPAHLPGRRRDDAAAPTGFVGDVSLAEFVAADEHERNLVVVVVFVDGVDVQSQPVAPSPTSAAALRHTRS